MSTFTNLTYHIVFSTKYRLPLIRGQFQKRLYEYIGGILRSQGNHLFEIGGVEDHIHLLTSLSKKQAICDAIRQIKANSSKWSNEHPELTRSFEWQKGYGAFTVSYSQKEVVAKYIQNQVDHHKKINFKDEYICFLEKHDIEFDKKYIFEEEYCG